MKCKNCGASLLDTDKFCDQCGQKVVRERRCPECGAALREGTKFCPKCGRLIGGRDADDEGKVFVRDNKTTDIPIADIEQNILSETERELHTVKKPKSKPKSKSVPAPEVKKREKPAPVKKKVYEEWDDEEDEEDEDDDAGGSFMVIVTVVMALLIITVAAMLAFFTLRSRPIKNYGASIEENDNEAEDGDGDAENDGEAEIRESNEADGNGTELMQPIGTLSIISNVNVRDNPSTEGTNIIKVAKEGETYEYLGTEQDGSWYRILLEDGSTGYVFEKYVSAD